MTKRNAFATVAILAVVALVAGTIACNNQSAPAPVANPGAVAQGPTPTVSPTAWQVPVDVFPPSPSPTPTPTQTDYQNFGWQTFVALNWPSLSGGSMGQPNTNLSIGATASNGALVPAVWNTYRDVSTIMLANGKDPGAQYTQPTAISSTCPAMGSGNPVAPGFQPLYIDNSTFKQASFLKSYVNQAAGGPLVDQEGWYTLEQMFVDPSEYAYIQGNGYFQGSAQATAYSKNGKLAPFPKDGQGMGLPAYAQYGALEVKATWRVLDPVADKAILPRYYTQWGYFLQADAKTCQGPTLFGLIGMHILRLTPSTSSTWFWASFEQVDNTIPPSGAPATLAAPNTPNGNCGNLYNKATPPVSGNIAWNNSNKPDNICQTTLIPSSVQQINKTWQGQLQGTVWQYYQMVNTLNPCPAGSTSCYTFPPIYDPKNTVNLKIYANAAIESYFQDTTNCMSCHGSAAGDGVPKPLTGTNQIFTFVLENAYWPSTSATATNKRLMDVIHHPPQSKLAVQPKPAAEEEKYKKK